jgi:uncharacterized protein YggE
LIKDGSMRWIAVVLLLAAGCSAAEETPGIHVAGHGEVLAEPDLARFVFEVVQQGQNAEALKAEVDEVIARVVALADRLGVAREDVATAIVRVTPRYRHSSGAAVMDGVTVQRTMRVTLRDLDQYTRLVNGVLGLGINQIQNVSLDFSDRSGFERRALDAAIEDAAEEAHHVAQKLGVTAGRVLNVQVSGRAATPRPMMAMRAEAADVRPGRLTIERSVNITYAIE